MIFPIAQVREFVEQIAGVPKAEDPSRYQKRELDEADIRRERGWTSAQIDEAIEALSFPKPLFNVKDSAHARLNRRPLDVRRKWSATEVERWHERMRSFGLTK